MDVFSNPRMLLLDFTNLLSRKQMFSKRYFEINCTLFPSTFVSVHVNVNDISVIFQWHIKIKLVNRTKLLVT